MPTSRNSPPGRSHAFELAYEWRETKRSRRPHPRPPRPSSLVLARSILAIQTTPGPRAGRPKLTACFARPPSPQRKEPGARALSVAGSAITPPPPPTPPTAAAGAATAAAAAAFPKRARRRRRRPRGPPPPSRTSARPPRPGATGRRAPTSPPRARPTRGGPVARVLAKLRRGDESKRDGRWPCACVACARGYVLPQRHAGAPAAAPFGVPLRPCVPLPHRQACARQAVGGVGLSARASLLGGAAPSGLRCCHVTEPDH